jgi:glutathione S-transferase
VKLFYSPTSPYVRKVLACAIARGIEQRITLVTTNPHVSPPDLLAGNPLSKVPCLLTDDGLALFDSPVICEYLDTEGNEMPMFPSHGGARWIALKRQALGDGMLDAAILRRGEAARPRDDARDAVIARQRAAVERSLDVLEREPPHRVLDIGSLTVACALGYLDLRFAADDWRAGRPKLAEFHAAMMNEPALARTVPKDPV